MKLYDVLDETLSAGKEKGKQKITIKTHSNIAMS